jgi:hypothetical protein
MLKRQLSQATLGGHWTDADAEQGHDDEPGWQATRRQPPIHGPDGSSLVNAHAATAVAWALTALTALLLVLAVVLLVLNRDLGPVDLLAAVGAHRVDLAIWGIPVAVESDPAAVR